MLDSRLILLVVLLATISVCLFYIAWLLFRRYREMKKNQKGSALAKKWKDRLSLKSIIPAKKKAPVGPRFVIPGCSPTTVACQIQLPHRKQSGGNRRTDETRDTDANSTADDGVFSSDSDTAQDKICKFRRRSEHVSAKSYLSDQNRSKSLPGKIKGKIRKVSSALDSYNSPIRHVTEPIVPYPSDLGQLELKVTYDDRTRTVHLRIVAISNAFISATAFLGVAPVYSEFDAVPADVPTQYLVRKQDKNLSFNDISAVTVSVDAHMHPQPAHGRQCKSTRPFKGLPEKFLLVNQEIFFRNVEEFQLYNSICCFDIHCSYGAEAYERIRIGQVVKTFHDIRPNVTEAYMMDIGVPVDETELAAEYRLPDDLGKVVLCLSHNLLAGTLSVRINKLINLPDVGNHPPNIQVRVSLLFCESRIDRSTTQTIQKSNNPSFHETFTYSLSREKLNQSKLLLEIRHCGRVGKTTLGYVMLGNDCRGSCKHHWEKLTSLRYSNLFEEVEHRISATRPQERSRAKHSI